MSTTLFVTEKKNHLNIMRLWDSKDLGELFEDYPHFTNKLTHSAVRCYRIVSS